jgi:hypothetical protein
MFLLIISEFHPHGTIADPHLNMSMLLLQRAGVAATPNARLCRVGRGPYYRRVKM